MRMIKLGKTGKEISKMGLGTWSIGGGSAWGGDHDLQTVVDTICEAPKKYKDFFFLIAWNILQCQNIWQYIKI